MFSLSSQYYPKGKIDPNKKIEKYNQKQTIYNPEIHIVGTDGAGNTSLCNALLNAGVNVNSCNDYDSLKHLPEPKSFNKDYNPRKILFIFGPIDRSIYSHYRRWKNANNHLKKLGSDIVPNTYAEYVKKSDLTGKDLSGYTNQFKNWKNSFIDT